MANLGTCQPETPLDNINERLGDLRGLFVVLYQVILPLVISALGVFFFRTDTYYNPPLALWRQQYIPPLSCKYTNKEF